MSVNKVILVGNVGKDPEVRHLDTGVAVANFPLATSESYNSKSGERVTTTEWHNIVLWRGLAEVAEKYVTKGRQLYIEGRIRTRSYDDKDGNKRYITEIYGDQMQMLGTRADNQNSPDQNIAGQSNQSSQKITEPDIEEPEGDEDLPF
ncbi:MAG TPA: single-stranded DNA-binding protein [Draconibacterium sp.]|nr:single-stranded DNA-binding protein [Draconibacterium sp.]